MDIPEVVRINGHDYILREHILQEIDKQNDLNSVFESEAAYVHFWEIFNDSENITSTSVSDALITLNNPNNILPKEGETVIYVDTYNHWQIGLYMNGELHNGVEDDNIYSIKGWQSLPKIE